MRFLLLLLMVSYVNLIYANDSTLIKYSVNADTLNIRKEPSPKSAIIGRLIKNDTVLGTLSNNWIKVTFNDDFGYVSSKYVSKYRKPGFVSGFSDGFLSVFFYVFLSIFAIILVKKKRVKDGRFKKGYRELPFSTLETFKIFLYTTIVSGFIGLITGIFSWLKYL